MHRTAKVFKGAIFFIGNVRIKLDVYGFAVVLMIAGMIIYVMTEDFGVRPPNWLQNPRQSSSGNGRAN